MQNLKTRLVKTCAGLMALGLLGSAPVMADNSVTGESKLELTDAWDKVFPKSDKVRHRKITFHNRYGITLAADLYEPLNAKGRLPAIAVSGPFGAVKE